MSASQCMVKNKLENYRQILKSLLPIYSGGGEPFSA